MGGACSPSEEHAGVSDVRAEQSTTTEGGAGSAEPADASTDSFDAEPDAENDELDASVPDIATEASACADVFGPIYVPDADDANACSASTPCGQGLLCAGASCDERWECIPHFAPHPCPIEAVAYCGCDGVTFLSPRGCVDRPYLHIGSCGEGTNCDPTELRCSEQEPNCPPGTLASIVNGIYGPCVPFSSCRCEFLWECPHRETYACDRTTWRCGELPPTP